MSVLRLCHTCGWRGLPVIDSRTAVIAIHVGFWRRRIRIRVCCEYDIPLIVDVMDLGRPKIERIVHTHWRLEDEFRFRGVPVAAYLSTSRKVKQFYKGHPYVRP